MPHKDPNKRRAYVRQWTREDRAKNPEKYREVGRKSAELYRKRHRHGLYQQRLEIARDRYCKLKTRCKKKGLDLHLTYEQYAEIIADFTSCHYCDRPLGKTGSALDRVNNEPFYAEAIKACDKVPPIQNSRVEGAPEEEQGLQHRSALPPK